MKKLSPLARTYIWSVLALGALLAVWNGPSLPGSLEEWIAFAALTAAAAVAQSFPVVSPKNQAYELTPIFIFAGIFLISPGPLVLLIVIAYIPEWVKARKAWYIQLFNIAIYLIQASAAHCLLVWLHWDPTPALETLPSLAAAVLAAGLFTLLNHLLLAVVLRLARGHSWRETRLFELEYFLTDGALLCTGVITAILWQISPWLLSLTSAPIFLIYRALNTPNLQEQARTDAKTGLYNAKHFNQVMKEEIRRAARFDRPMAVIMADLDLLRNINNSYGHLAGDVVLKGVADIIRRGLREYDVAARFGGEEFVVLLPECDGAQALVVAERIRKQVEETSFTVSTSVEPIRATLSQGIASFPTDGAEADELIHQADLAVYYAKLLGRNRAWSSSPESQALGLGSKIAGRPTVEPQAEAQAVADVRRGPASDGADDGAAGPKAAGFRRESLAVGTTPASKESPNAAPRAEGASHGSGANGSGRIDPGSKRRARAGDLTWPIALFVSATTLVTLALWVLAQPWQARADWLGLAGLAILTAGAQSLAVEIYGRGRISTSAIFIIAGAILFGLPGALVLAPVIPAIVWVRNGGRFYRALFDVGDTSLSGAMAALVYADLSRRLPSQEPLLLVGPAVLAALAYYVVNVGLISVAIGLTEKRSPLGVWEEKFRWLPLHYAVFGLLALLIVLAYRAIGLYGLLSFFAPPVMMRYVMKQYIDRTESNVSALKRANAELTKVHSEVVSTLQELRQTYDATLVALSAALDSRDAETEDHCRRVVEFAEAIGRRLGLGEQELAGLMNGALLHDVGKIGVPDAILRKRGTLTVREWEIMRTHPEVGYRMLQHIGFLKDALPVVRYHHECYDGSGYPEGLRDEQIPLGARIFAVADAFHAMTSDRPYRSASSVRQAREEIRRCGGSQFDPVVVDAFEEIDPAELARMTGRALEAAPQKAEREPTPLMAAPRLAVVGA